MPEGHRFADGRALSAVELATEPLIAWPRATSPRTYDAFTSAMDATGEKWKLASVVSGLSNVASRVLSGRCAAVMIAALASIDPDLGVVSVPIVDLSEVDQFLVWQADERHEGLPRLVEELS